MARKKSLPLLVLRSGIILPGTVKIIKVGRAQSRITIEEAYKAKKNIVVSLQNDIKAEVPIFEDIDIYGTEVKINSVEPSGSNAISVTLEGLGRVKILELTQEEPYFIAKYDSNEDDIDEVEADISIKLLIEFLDKNLGGVNTTKINNEYAASRNKALFLDKLVIDLAILDEVSRKEFLQLSNLIDRVKLIIRLINQSNAAKEIEQKTREAIGKEIDSLQSEHFLRKQLKVIKDQLKNKYPDSEGSSGDDESLESRLKSMDLPPKVRNVVDKELQKLESLNSFNPDYQVTTNYLRWIADLPWNSRVTESVDIFSVKNKLDIDHYGLKEIKERIVEHLAVLKITESNKGAILCLVGPPGVGKTSLGQSIADALHRPFVRIALGGVRDEADIRGHRRTYIGAIPGRLIHGLREAKVKNPVIMLDEIDKLVRNTGGDPESALLEVLDPEQNKTFTDHFMNVPFDLSEALFICTANSLDTISSPLRDRLEIVHIEGYTYDEKLNIAKNYIIPRRFSEYKIDKLGLSIQDDVLREVILNYTRESGVRQLDRLVNKISRRYVLRLEESLETADVIIETEITNSVVEKILGKPKYDSDAAEKPAVPGIAIGLAWTPVGGDILFIEASVMTGTGKVNITGQLGDVMKESVSAALTYIRVNAKTLGISREFDKIDVHIHVPAGAIPKDGPSAGITMLTALASALSERKVVSKLAMTGECTLRGRVLPVGGIKAKMLAAHLAGINTVILPKKNEKDLEELPDEVKAGINFHLVNTMDEVLKLALEDDTKSKMAKLTTYVTGLDLASKANSSPALEEKS